MKSNCPPVEERFWANVDKDSAGDCWVWTGYKDHSGYGNISAMAYGNRQMKAHRLSWTLHFGEIPEGMHVCHICDNPPCVKPTHLFLGTNSDNRHDMMVKGRHRTYNKDGEKNPNVKLTVEKVVEIRMSNLHVDELAKIYGINRSHVQRIRAGVSWPNAPGPITPFQKASPLSSDERTGILNDRGRGMSQKQIAEKYSVTQSYVSAVTKGVYPNRWRPQAKKRWMQTESEV